MYLVYGLCHFTFINLLPSRVLFRRMEARGDEQVELRPFVDRVSDIAGSKMQFL